MLIELFGKNFGCFRDEFELSLLAADIDPSDDRGVIVVPLRDQDPLRLLRTIGIYGANASGKSTLLRAPIALSTLLRSSKLQSDDPLEAWEPFALGDAATAPTELGIKFVADGLIHEYFVSFTAAEILTERLRFWDGDDDQVLLDRSGPTVRGNWTEHEQFALVTQDFRKNASLLSLADRFSPSLASPTFKTVHSVLGHELRPSQSLERAAARLMQRDPDFATWFRDQVRLADLGITDVRVTEVERQLGPHFGESSTSFVESDVKETWRDLSLEFVHSTVSSERALPLAKESFGTRRIIELAPMLYQIHTSANPGAVFVDELDASMHPLLLKHLVRECNNRPASDAAVQLIFSAHDTTLIDGEARDAVLRRDQVYFTEKDYTGAARLYGLVEFRERSVINMRKRYLEGRYGAIPSITTTG